MNYARHTADGISALAPGSTIDFTYTYTVNGNPVSEPKQISYATMELCWSDAERAAIGIYPIVDDVVPAGKVITGTSFELGAGVINRRYTLADIPPETLQAQLQQQIVSAVQERLDAFARTRGYDGILSACTYPSSAVQQFATEGQYCVAQRDATWAALYQLLAEVKAGTRAVPTGYAEIEPDLPALVWPS